MVRLVVSAACINMIKQQLRTGNILDDRIIDLYLNTPRDVFVPVGFKEFAYSDMQIPLAHGQRMMTPLEEAQLLQAISLTGNETVLEIGTGSGFLTALLSKLSKQVISIDCFPDFTQRANEILKQQACHNVTLLTHNGCRGYVERAPFDVVIFSGVIPELTKTHSLQVLPGGKLFVLMGKNSLMQAILHSLDHNGNWTQELIYETNLPPLVNCLEPNEFQF